MHKFTRHAGIALATAAGLVAATPAVFAAGTFTVTAGSATPGTTVGWTAATTGTTPQIHFDDTTSNIAFTCDSGTAAGTTTAGSGLSGFQIATIDATKTTWTNCHFIGLNLTFTGTGTWALNAATGSATGASGNVSYVNLAASGTGSFGTTCAFTITGSVPTTYTNADTTLAINGGGLTISGVSGACGSLGILKNGDAATLQADYAVTANNSADNPIAVTAP